MKLEAFLEEDKDRYIALASDFYDSPAVLGGPDLGLFQRNFDHIIAHEDALGFFLEVEGQQIGYVLCAKMFSTEVGAPSLWIEELTIDQAYQGKGFGSQVFTLIHDMFPEVKRFRLEVSLDNPKAKKLYERLGYTQLAYEQMIYDRK